jgi:hypothetical protein
MPFKFNPLTGNLDLVNAAGSTYTNEDAQDAVGGILTDTASIDLTYNDGANTISAAVLPAGVDHDALSNFVANEHIDHTSVTLTAGTGLSGGGDISSNRTFNLDLSDLTSDTPVVSDTIAFYDTSGADTNKVLISDFITAINSTIDHGTLAGLTDDDHTQYAILAGRSGGQTLGGSTLTGQDLTLRPNLANTTTGAVIINGPNLNPTVNNTTNLGTSSLRYSTSFSNRIANYVSTTVTPTVTGATLLSGRFNNTGGGSATVSVVTTGSNAANFLMGSVLNTSADAATFTVGGGGNFGGGLVRDGGSITIVGNNNFVWGTSASAGSSIFTDLAAEGNFIYGEAFPGAVGAASINASGPGAAGCFVGGWIQGSDTSATASAINVSYFGDFAQGMVVDGGSIVAGALGSFAQGYATLLGAISSAGDGSFAQGYAETGSIIASGAGCVAHGAVVGAYAITASGDGSIALGYANGGSLTASANGSGAFGYASGGVSIIASAANAFQFGPGTNAEATTLKIGVLGSGIRLIGTTTTPASPTNGDIKQNATGTMINRSNGFLYRMGTPYVAKTGNYTLVVYDDHTVNVTSGTNTQTLPTAVGCSGSIFVIKNTGTGTVTVATTSSQTFDNDGTTLTLVQNECVTVQSNNANWIILSRY